MLETRTLAPYARSFPRLRETWSNDPLASFRREVDRLFDGFFTDLPEDVGAFQPRIDVREGEEDVLIEADLPGVTPDQLDVNVRDDLVTIAGRRQAQEDDRGAGWYRRERVLGDFERTVRLPFDVDPDAVAAKYEHGVLRVRVRKPEGHRSRLRRIPITHQGG